MQLQDIGEWVAWLRVPRRLRGSGIPVLPTVESAVSERTLQRKLAAASAFYDFHLRSDVGVELALSQWTPGSRRGGFKGFLVHAERGARRREIRAIELAAEAGTPWLRVAGIKLVLDGVIDACTAAMRHPYADGSNAAPIWPLDDLAPVVVAADAAGLQIAMHAIGDAASGIALDALEHAHAVNGDRHRRHRIEHLEYADPADIVRLARLGVTASMQPVHADPAIWANWAAMLGDERADRGFAWTEFTDAGARLAFSTDAPTAPHEALPNLYVAATRRSALDGSFPPSHPEYAVPLEDAVVHATRDAAASCLDDDVRGSIAPGLAADFAVLDRDPFTEGAEALLEARVVRTVVAGATVYEV